MNFRKATDDLLACVTHEQLAGALGVSVASVRQARLVESAKAHRTPPKDWEVTVAILADQKAAHFRRLADRLKRRVDAETHKP